MFMFFIINVISEFFSNPSTVKLYQLNYEEDWHSRPWQSAADRNTYYFYNDFIF